MHFSWRKSVLLTLSILAVLFFIALAVSWRQFLITPLTQHPIVFDIAPGSSIKTVSKKLHAMGVVQKPSYFVFLAFLDGVTKHIKAGEYQIDAGSTPQQFIMKLAKGKVVLHPFTIVEGWNLNQVLNGAKKNPYLRHNLNTTNIDLFAKKLSLGDKSLEGNLYPDTYLFAKGVNDTVIIKKAYALMQKKLTKAWKDRDKTLFYKTPYDALIIASLIEKETARANEREKIAGVIIRRIQKNMLLQIDASVIYGLGSNYKGKLTKSDLKVNTPYNTYMHKGLPPSPIAMPGYPSIVAALHPLSGSEIYYVAKGDGSHEFTNTLEEHRKAIHKYRMNYLKDMQINEPEQENLSFSMKQKDPFSMVLENISWYFSPIVVTENTHIKAVQSAVKKSHTVKSKAKKPRKKSKSKVPKKGHKHVEHKK